MNEEVLRILEMVKSGRITPEEGEKLLSAIGQGGEAGKSPAGKRTMLRVRVDVKDPEKSEQAKVNVNVPLAIAKKAMGLLSLIPKEAKAELEQSGIDLNQIDLKGLIELFEDGEINEDLVDIVTGDERKGATVKVYVD
ncbi:MAG: SHOCT-like domain-containing protein [Burkholderiales bacterium]